MKFKNNKKMMILMNKTNKLDFKNIKKIEKAQANHLQTVIKVKK
jgi:hypothetical protein